MLQDFSCLSVSDIKQVMISARTLYFSFQIGCNLDSQLDTASVLSRGKREMTSCSV